MTAVPLEKFSSVLLMFLLPGLGRLRPKGTDSPPWPPHWVSSLWQHHCQWAPSTGSISSLGCWWTLWGTGNMFDNGTTACPSTSSITSRNRIWPAYSLAPHQDATNTQLFCAQTLKELSKMSLSKLRWIRIRHRSWRWCSALKASCAGYHGRRGRSRWRLSCNTVDGNCC